MLPQYAQRAGAPQARATSATRAAAQRERAPARDRTPILPLPRQNISRNDVRGRAWSESARRAAKDDGPRRRRTDRVGRSPCAVRGRTAEASSLERVTQNSCAAAQALLGCAHTKTSRAEVASFASYGSLECSEPRISKAPADKHRISLPVCAGASAVSLRRSGTARGRGAHAVKFWNPTAARGPKQHDRPATQRR